MKKLILFLSLGLAAFGQTNYHTLSGYVLDSTDRSPLAKASINVNYGQATTFTDDKGFFSILVPTKQFSMLVRHLGFKPNRAFYTVSKDTELTIQLFKVSQDLEEVIITSKANTNDIKRPILGVNTLSIKTLNKIPAAMGEVDILRGLQMLPGVTSVGEAANGVNIRGGTTDQNLLLLDDMPIFNPTHMFGLFSAFPSESISSFDLYKGNVPARYGGRASAVLDVSLANPDLEKFKIQGGLSPIANRLKLDVPIIAGKMAISVSGRGAFNDWALPFISEKLKEVKAKFGDGSAKLFYKINTKNTLTLSSYYSKDFFQTALLGTIGSVNATSTQYDYATSSAAMRWFSAINSKTNVQTTLVYSQFEPKTLLPEYKSDNKVKISSGVTYKQAKSNINHTTAKNKLEVGISAIHYEIDPGRIDPGTSVGIAATATPLEQALESGVYIEDEYELGKKLTFSAGLRYSIFNNLGPIDVRTYEPNLPKDDLSFIGSETIAKNKVAKEYGGFEPRLGLQWSLSSQTSLKFGANIMRQYIQVVSNTTTPLPTSRWKTSDTHIKPQVSTLFTGGFFHNFKDQVYELSLEGYTRKTANIIDYKPGADFLLNPYPETQLLQGRNNAYGAEMMFSKKKGELSGWINYTYSRSLNQVKEGDLLEQQINNGSWFPANYDRPHSFNLTTVLNQGKHHDFSFNFTYSTGRPYSAPKGTILFQGLSYPFYDERNNSRIPDYHRLDFAWNIYNPAMKDRRYKSHWTFTLFNLYGRKNAYSVFIKTVGSRLIPYKLTVFGATIPSLAYNFKF